MNGTPSRVGLGSARRLDFGSYSARRGRVRWSARGARPASGVLRSVTRLSSAHPTPHTCHDVDDEQRSRRARPVPPHSHTTDPRPRRRRTAVGQIGSADRDTRHSGTELVLVLRGLRVARLRRLVRLASRVSPLVYMHVRYGDVSRVARATVSALSQSHKFFTTHAFSISIFVSLHRTFENLKWSVTVACARSTATAHGARDTHVPRARDRGTRRRQGARILRKQRISIGATAATYTHSAGPPARGRRVVDGPRFERPPESTKACLCLLARLDVARQPVGKDEERSVHLSASPQ